MVTDLHVEDKKLGVVTDGYGRILRKFVRCIYNPSRRHYEAKGETRDYVISYRSKSEASRFAKKMGVPQTNVVRFGNALHSAWAICLSDHHPDCLIAIFE